MKKKCFNCNIVMPLSCFYKHSSMADGHLNKCKECTKNDVRKNRKQKITYYRKYDRDRASLPKRVKLRKEVADRWKKDPKLRKINNKRKKEWIKKNTIKRAAHIITGNAIKNGKLIPNPCVICGKKKVEAHHEDYEKPLEVIWLCCKHHNELHAKKREQLRAIKSNHERND